MDKDESRDYIENWIILFNEAARSLRPEQFNIWLLGVGSSGTFEERCKVGEAILGTLTRGFLPPPLCKSCGPIGKTHRWNIKAGDHKP